MAYVGVKPAEITSATQAEIAGDLTVDTNTLKVDSSNNRVGIGMSPVVNLDIAEDSAGVDAIIGITAGTGGRAQIRSEAQSDGTSSELSFHTMSGSNTSERLRIDSSGKVGIGLTSMPYSTAATQLSVGDTGGSGGINIVSGTSSLGVIRFADGTTSSDPYRGRIEYNHSNDSLHFGTSGTYRMTIDASGRVTMSNQPAFLAYRNSGDWTTTSGSRIAFTNTHHNVGNGYSTSNYQFTAPVAGRYFFGGQMWAKVNGGMARWHFEHNGTHRGQFGSHSTPQDTANTGATILNLAASDYVTMVVDNGNVTAHAGSSNFHSFFYGYLIG